MANWNPWHGCRKYSEGCQNCYVYRIDSAHGKDASQIFLNREFDLPMRRGRKGYLLAPGTKVYTCLSSITSLESTSTARQGRQPSTFCPPSSCPGRSSENEGFIMQADCGVIL